LRPALLRCPTVDPALEKVDLLVRPLHVAWHRARANSPENRIGVRLDLVERPEVNAAIIASRSDSRNSGLMLLSNVGAVASRASPILGYPGGGTDRAFTGASDSGWLCPW
jgi:hypothetical protein